MACISKRLKVTQAFIKNAVEQGDYTTLLQEPNMLLGDETKAGQLSLKLNFDYVEKVEPIIWVSKSSYSCAENKKYAMLILSLGNKYQ